MITKDEIKTQVDISVLVEDDIGPPVKESGDWQLYFCPFHTNTRTPALGVNPKTGTFKCFSCQAQGDIFSWRMLREDEDFKQAFQWFQEQRGKLDTRDASQRRLKSNIKPQASPHQEPPTEQWQKRGRKFIRYAQEQLWQHEAGLEYGLDELFRRGLNPKTIQTWGLGYNPEWVKDSPARWGISISGEDQKIWLARGLVIPCEIEDDLWYLKIRVFNTEGKPVSANAKYGKYSQPSGGRGALFGADKFQGMPNLLMAESELDAILAWQEAGDLMDVATLGGAGKRLNSRWLPYLLSYRRIFLAYDQDKPGQAGAQKLASISSRLIVSPPPQGDLTDFHIADGNIRAWVQAMVSQ